MIDIRIPIGLMFSLLGAMLSLYGLFTSGNILMYQRSLGININLISGLGMLAFGILMLAFPFMKKRRSPKKD